MAAQLLSLLGGMLRGAAMALPRAAKSFAAAGRALRPAMTPHPLAAPGRGALRHGAQVNLAALARQLGTPSPSPAQIATAQQQVNQHNQQFAMPARASAAAGHLGGGITELGKFTAALTVAERGLTGLARVINGNAVDALKIYSATMAAESARQGRFALQYNQERARLVSGSTTALGESLRRNSKEWQPYMALAENVTNGLLKLAVDLSTAFEGFLESIGFTDMVRGINATINKNANKQNAGPMAQVIRDALAGRNAGPLNGRPNERRGDRM